jgi:hypothetical protein
MTARLILKRASASRPDGQWSDEDDDVLADGKGVGRIYEDDPCALPGGPEACSIVRIPTKSPGHSEMMSPGVPT